MLEKIIEVKKDEMTRFEQLTEREYKSVSFYKALTEPNRKVGLIAEVKKASPSKGIIREDFNPVTIAMDYAAAGADAISVLTDQMFFQGSKEYLTKIKEVVNIPILRKDFLIDRRQILESKYLGADAILLIGEVLDPKELEEFYIEAKELGLDCLVEVHSIKTVESILKEFTPKIIGVNNRDLSTFHTTIEQTKLIVPYLPKESLIVSESGLYSFDDLETVHKAGAGAVLVGEALMKESEVQNAILKLFGEIVVE